jgi:O-succinylbenzoic acid--CoA ligase
MELAAEWILSALERHSERIVFDDGVVVLSADQLLAGSDQRAAQLDGLELTRVALTGAICADWLINLIAIWRAGGVAVPISERADDERRERLLSKCAIQLDGLKVEALGHAVTAVQFDGAAFALLTSGTTGLGREVILTHRNLDAHAAASAEALELVATDRWLTSLPVSHTGGLGVIVRSLRAGARASLRDGFDIEQWRELIESGTDPVTLCSVVPTMLVRLLDAGIVPGGQLRSVVVGGAPLLPGLRERALDSDWPVRETWGMTETVGMATIARTSNDPGAGPPLSCVELSISAQGEVKVSGTSISPSVSVEGPFATGDLGVVRSGSLVITGRSSNLIISGGENVSPERVEAVLCSLEGVEECRVFGEADPQWGEAVVAELVTTGNLSDESVLLHCRARLSPWEVPKRILRSSQLTRTETGKIVRGGRDD